MSQPVESRPSPKICVRKSSYYAANSTACEGQLALPHVVPLTLHDTQESYNNSPSESQLSKVSFREVTESVRFRRAKEIIPPSSERNLTKLLINKQRERAYYAVEDEPCENITQLIDFLNIDFGLSRTI